MPSPLLFMILPVRCSCCDLCNSLWVLAGCFVFELSWTPNLIGNDSDNEDEESLGVHDQEDLDVEDDAQSVAEKFDDIGFVQTNKDVDLAQGVNTQVADHVERSPIKSVGLNEDHVVNDPLDTQAQEQVDSDPFELDHLINQKRGKTNITMTSSVTPDFPPGFSPNPIGEHHAIDSFTNLSDGESI
ncbi:hypothetical protein Tco_0683217 [Tanacetum coccineum]|uniref:Uncharacterized protein n=1 Tax=Tanacetum coccineum TaxID=301880 RepID=A0ABQ4XV38_9ASTR